MQKKFDPAYSYVLIYIFAIFDNTHKDCLKVGKATIKLDDESQYASILTPNSSLLNKAAKKRIDLYTQTAGISYTLLHTELAERKIESGNTIFLKYFEDHQVHKVLKNSGIKNIPIGGSREWFKTDLETVKKAIKAVKEGRNSLTGAEITSDQIHIVFRPEQIEAIEMTLKRFKRHNKMLWNAKMRFGKTLSALEVVKKGEFKKTIILTHRPVVDEGWGEDFNKIFHGLNYYYCAKGTPESDIIQHVTNNDSFIFFASIQNMRGSETVGGKFDKNGVIFNTNWDLVIIDEAHEGTRTSLGDDVLKEIIKEEQHGETKQIYLSGTPFNLFNDFDDDEVYTWDYVMEQKAKQNWDIIHGLDSNPYEGLPKLSIYTYDIANAIPGYENIEEKAFNFREFFRVWTGLVENDGQKIPDNSESGKFVHEDDVKSFLNMLCKKEEGSNYPFSKDEYRDYFNHTLWMLPGVKEARALEALLNEHKIFGYENFTIVNVAGEVPSDTKDPLERVNNAITQNPDQTRTITLSCGRLTTGVSVKPWTAVLMLSGTNTTSASPYLQTIFRVQTPANIKGKIKDRCFVFDFAPDRTLQMVAEAGKLGTRPGSSDSSSEAKMKEFLNFCPVIAIQGSEMRNYDVNSMLRQLKRYYAARVAQNGFDDIKLYNDSLLKLTDLDKKKFDELKKIVGVSKAADIQKRIIISESGLGPEEQQAAEEAAKKKRERKKLTEEEKLALQKLKEARDAKSKAISILRAISIRIPLLVYGAEKDIEEVITIENFAGLIDDESWKEFMPPGITKSKFNEFIEYYDKDIFVEAGNQIRRKVKAADDLNPTERVKKITEIFSTFKNPDKETVLTPWRVVNMHISDCLGGYNFYDENNTNSIENPRFIDRGLVTAETVSNRNTKILEINSKSGLYPLYITYSIYRERLNSYKDEEKTPEVQTNLWKQTLNENIFVICKTEMSKYITKRTLLGYKSGSINAHFFEDLVNQFKNKLNKISTKIRKRSYWKEKGVGYMKFDAIVGNPPYQEMDGGNAGSALPVYNLFVEGAMEMKPQFISMIIPARWYIGGRGLNKFRERMLNDKRISILHDYPDANDCFRGVEIKGGVCYFLIDKEIHTSCNIYTHKKSLSSHAHRPLLEPGMDTFIRYEQQVSILKKVLTFNEKSFSDIVSPNDPYGFDVREKNSYKRVRAPYMLMPFKDAVTYYYNGWRKEGLGYVEPTYIRRGKDWVSKVKIFVPRVWGTGEIQEDWVNPFIVGPNSCSTETYLTIGPFNTESEAKNVLSYTQTKFFHLMVSILKNTQQAMQRIYTYVPMQDFSKSWNDENLFNKYGLTQKEIDFIITMVKPD